MQMDAKRHKSMQIDANGWEQIDMAERPPHMAPPWPAAKKKPTSHLASPTSAVGMQGKGERDLVVGADGTREPPRNWSPMRPTGNWNPAFTDSRDAPFFTFPPAPTPVESMAAAALERVLHRASPGTA